MYVSKIKWGRIIGSGWKILVIVSLLLLSGLTYADNDIEVEGPIQAIGQDSLVVNGFVFWVDGNTEIKGDHGEHLSLSDLSEGDFVEVEADVLPDSTLLATEIELKVDGNKIEVEGFIQNIGSDSLVVNSIVFWVNANTEIRGEHGAHLTLADLSVGDFVEVKAVLQPDSSFLAEKIKLKNDKNRIKVEGLIQAIGGDSLTVNQIVFFVDANTEIRGPHGTTINFSDLQVGDRVKVRAVLRGDGTYRATRIKLKNNQQDEIEVKAPIDTLFNDTLVVAGMEFWTDANTEIVDDDGNPILFSDLQIGMIVEVKGEVQPDSSLYARKIEVEDFFQDEIEVTGIVDSLGTDWLSVLSLTFFVDANTQIFNADNHPIPFADLAVGMKVEVRAHRMPDSTLLADRIKVKNPNNNEIEFQGAIDSLVVNMLRVGGVQFLVDSNTLILDHQNNPITFGDLTVGLIVEVRAVIQPDGSFLATRIKIEDSPGFSRISGVVVSVTPGYITVSRPQYQVQTNTVVLNERYQPIPYSRISVGQYVTLWADESTNGSPVALQIKQDTPANPTGIPPGTETEKLPATFELGQNYPNPFNPTTTIPVTIRGTQWHNVELIIYNSLGQEVRVLFSGLLNSGRFRFRWDGRNQRGELLSTAIYLYQLKVDNSLRSTRRMLLIK